ncbi:MAG: SMC-Scp complex subunit ScpB [Proteobacteria bacterium]|nr:SMC-Scp complex subunit ScpB [Pseudomonadota bacterium]
MSETGVDVTQIKHIVEAAIIAADEPLTVEQLVKLFQPDELDRDEGRIIVREALNQITQETEGRGYELKQVASGFRFQVRQEMSQWVSRLWEEKPPRYSRALLETLALVAYKQPVTRGDIEQVRGVAVSQNIMRTLTERGWIRVVGQREVPGRPSMYGTTKEFLDYFNLKSLDALPPMSEIKALIEPILIDVNITGVAGEVVTEEETQTERALAAFASERADPTSIDDEAWDFDELPPPSDFESGRVDFEVKPADLEEHDAELDDVDLGSDDTQEHTDNTRANVVQLPTNRF